MLDVRLIGSQEELDEVCKFRYRIYLDARHIVANDAQLLTDVFDAPDIGYNILVKMDGILVGSSRLTKTNKVGLPTDHYYDFKKFFGDQPYAAGSYMCADPKVRRQGIAKAMLTYQAELIKKDNLSGLVGAANPPIVDLYVKDGWTIVGPEDFSVATNRRFIPVVKYLK